MTKNTKKGIEMLVMSILHREKRVDAKSNRILTTAG